MSVHVMQPAGAASRAQNLSINTALLPGAAQRRRPAVRERARPGQAAQRDSDKIKFAAPAV